MRDSGTGSKAAVLVALALAVATPAVPSAPGESFFREVSLERAGIVVQWDRDAVRRLASASGEVRLAGFPLRDGLRVELEVEPFTITGPATRFVVGRRGEPDRPLPFDPSTVVLLRGTVVGHRDSSVFLALGERHGLGHVDLGPNGDRFLLSSRDGRGDRLAAGRSAVLEASPVSTLPPDVPMCGVAEPTEPDVPHRSAASPAGGPQPVRGQTQLELAVETDHEFYQLFGDLDDAAAYLVTLYGAVSDVFERDVGTRIELVFARLWDDPDDLFNVVQPSPLGDFANHWNTFMGAVTRDAAQLLSGRRDYPFGGQAYLSSLCGGSAYSVVGYATGFLAPPTTPSPYQYDASVTAHELGHNFGALHTHSYGIDQCDNPNSTPRRGPIMSYCGQTWSGGNANRDFYFHTIPVGSMRNHVAQSTCLILDCNVNGVADDLDIAASTSTDGNGNGIPDECEDCNGNSILDSQDILGASQDLNANGVPDECEPDCNATGVPDDRDIADGTSLDQFGNRIPDDCETDCDRSGVSDYTEIQIDMTRDVDRNARLDVCQDCDADGTPDLDALQGAHNLWIASGLGGSALREFHSSTGVLTRVADTAVQAGVDVVVAPSGNVWVASAADSRVMEFDRTGTFLRNLVDGGGLSVPTGLAVRPGGSLLVSSRGTDQVLEYDGVTGAPLGAFVAAGAGGLNDPHGLTFGPSGNLFVASDNDQILEYDGSTGAFVGAFVGAADNGGLSRPRGLTFKPDGHLLVASYGSNEVLEYDGSSGAPLGRWAQVGTSTVLTQVSPWGIRIGPNGNVFVARTGTAFGSGGGGPDDHQGHHDHHGESEKVQALHLSNAQVYEFDVRNGNFLRSHIAGNDHGLLFPTGFAWVPGWDVDCNFNLLPDNCDILWGTSADADANQVPDECEVDCNGNGRLDRLDVIPFGSARDCNANLTPDDCDVAGGASQDCTRNGIPDECEPDCNGNGVADSCDIDAGASRDCNANAVPDECDALDTLDDGTMPAWTVGAPGDDATSGVWERVNPVGTVAQPEFDHTPGAGRICYVTGQGAVGGLPSAADVDGGRTTLTTPVLDLTAYADPEIGYWRWYSNVRGNEAGDDVFRVEITSDGLAWLPVETVGPTGEGTQGGWFYHAFRVADIVSPSAGVRLRFIAEDAGQGSLVEAAVDDLVIVPDCCETGASCADGLSCTLDACNSISGACTSDLDPTTCLIAGACHAAGDLNPLDVCQVCDPALPGAWSPALPLEVSGVVVTGPTATDVGWNEQAGAVYDVAGGDIAALATDGGVTAATCLQDDLAIPGWTDPRPTPVPGGGYYYLVRSQKPCASGTYGQSSVGVERLPAAACP